MPADTSAVGFRRARAEDVPRFIELIAGASMPPLFVEDHIGGFVAAERDGAIIGCGGVEIYDDCAVIRSVVVDESARGLGLGRQLVDLLIADARTAVTTDLYLFTGDAWAFWKGLGFVDVTFDEWKAAPRMCWQYQFLSQNTDVDWDVHTMWRAT